MSDTPRTDAALVLHCYVPAAPVELTRELERENAKLRAALEYVRGLGTVYVYPEDWRSHKMGGPPAIENYEEIDLSEVGL